VVEEHNPAGAKSGTSGINRRAFVRRSAAVAGGLVVLGTMPGAGTAEAASEESAAYAPTTLSAAEISTLKAILARLLPVDSTGPGAVEAHVHVYIDLQLGTAPYAEDLPLYHQYLAAINQTQLGQFAALTAQQQDTLLQQIEAGKVASIPSSFFFLVLGHMREGMFSDPMYGGNYQFAGWDLIGFPGVKYYYTAAEQAIGTKVKPAHMSMADVGGKPVR
jgi:gluconate 2-dehydrogenase gamma chain